jgi:hypothetical protein
VGVISAGRDTMLLPRFHSDRLLRHCSTCEPIAHLAGAGHMDLLGPWPEPLALVAAAQQARGGMPEPGFDGVEARAHIDVLFCVGGFYGGYYGGYHPRARMVNRHAYTNARYVHRGAYAGHRQFVTRAGAVHRGAVHR